MNQEIMKAIMAVAASSMLDRIAEVESAHNFQAIGDDGKARGAWQMHRAAWDDANVTLSKAGCTNALSWAFGIDAHKPWNSRLAAASYVVILKDQYRLETKRNPSDFQVYIMWNIGFSGFRSYGFKTDKLPAKLLLNANYVETGK